MTKKHIKCFSVLLCILLVCISFTACSQVSKTVSNFTLDDYTTYTENFAKEINVGEIKDAETALQKADELFIETFGEETMEDEKPYRAFYDEENNCWLVRGTLQQPLFGGRRVGGVAEIIFDSDGNVLALWHGK